MSVTDIWSKQKNYETSGLKKINA